MKKDKNYWLERGKDGPQKEGFVCVGRGESPDLTSQLGIRHLFTSTTGGDHDGHDPSMIYYLTTEKFNSLFREEERKSKEQEIADLEAQIEKLKQEILEEKYKVGDLVFCFQEPHVNCVVRIESVSQQGIYGKYFDSAIMGEKSAFHFSFSDYNITKITL